MIDITSFFLFLSASVLVTIAPGPDVIFTITQGLTNGRRAGVTTAMGLAAGNLVHTIAAALGLSLLFQTSPAAFWVLKILGAVYLLYLAWLSIMHRNDPVKIESGKNRKQNLFWRGFLMNVMNPKVALFFIAFLPRFVVPENGNVVMQFIFLGVTFALQVVFVFGAAGFFAGYFGDILSHRKGFSRNMNLISGVVFVAIALSLLFL